MTEENRKEFLQRIKEEARLIRDLDDTCAQINFLEKTSKDIKNYFKLRKHLEYADNALTELQKEPLIHNCKHEIYIYLGRERIYYHEMGYAQVYKCLDCGYTKHLFEQSYDKEQMDKFKKSNLIIYPNPDCSASEIETEYYNSLISKSAEEAKGKVLGKYYKKNE